MLLSLILLNKTPFEAKWKCHLLESKAQEVTFDFSVLSVVSYPGQTTGRFSLPHKEKKLVPPLAAWFRTMLNAMMQSSKRWAVIHLRNGSPDFSLYPSPLVLVEKENIFGMLKNGSVLCTSVPLLPYQPLWRLHWFPHGYTKQLKVLKNNFLTD